MLRGDKNLKDSKVGLDITIKDTYFSISYTKTNKLITALYMITDIIDKEEPLRNKLRTLGADIISDIHLLQLSTNVGIPTEIWKKIGETVSFLNIAGAVNMISEMNCSILRKEFLALKQSLEESRQTNLLEFFKDENLAPLSTSTTKFNSIGHARIGVQKGSTLMKALSRVEMSDRTNFNILKKQRRDEIILVIKNNANSATITDIRIKGQGSLVSCGEKTLQRELVSMVKDSVLYRVGSKRWSKYSIKT